MLAASHSLLTLKDNSGYEAYYAILMGDRKGDGLIAGQLATLKDPKQMAALGFHEGIGFVPFGDISYTAFRTMTKDGGAPLRAASAKALENDPDPLTEDALVQTALSDKSTMVREAALQEHSPSEAIPQAYTSWRWRFQMPRIRCGSPPRRL